MKCPITAKRLALALSNAGMRPQDLANASGVSKASISQYLSGSHAPSNISSGKMATILKVSPVWLMGFDVPMYDEKTEKEKKIAPKFKTYKTVQIPILGQVAAGTPIDAIENIDGYVDIPESWAKYNEYFALSIRGDSMSPDIHDGDIVIVKAQPVVNDNEIAIVSVNGDTATCKRLRRYDNELCLISINPNYKTMRFTPEEVNSLPVTVLGKVVEVRRRMI